MSKLPWVVVALLGLIVVPSFLRRDSRAQSTAATAGADNSLAAWNALVDRYFDDYFAFNPTAGTSAGFHEYDSRVEDYSGGAVEREIAAMHAWEARVEAFDSKGLDETTAADHELLLATIRSTLLSLETIRSWKKNADVYSSGVTRARSTS